MESSETTQAEADVIYLLSLVDAMVESDGVDLEPDDLSIVAKIRKEYK